MSTKGKQFADLPRLIRCVLTLIASVALGPAPAALAATSGSEHHAADLLEIGRASEIRSAPQSPAAFKIVSYNIRWRGGDELRRLIELFQTDKEVGGAAVLGLQEVDRNKQRTNHENTVKVIAEALGMYYAWAAPPRAKPDDEE